VPAVRLRASRSLLCKQRQRMAGAPSNVIEPSDCGTETDARRRCARCDARGLRRVVARSRGVVSFVAGVAGMTLRLDDAFDRNVESVVSESD
jgi:hypothetical protein